jgi:hypothetical protein
LKVLSQPNTPALSNNFGRWATGSYIDLGKAALIQFKLIPRRANSSE